MPVTICLSHSTHDDATVAALRTALESHGVSVWADSQRRSGGEELTPRIREAIANAQHVVVLVSPRAINAPWVYKEVQLAQAVKRSRRDGYKVIPMLYDGVMAGDLSATPRPVRPSPPGCAPHRAPDRQWLPLPHAERAALLLGARAGSQAGGTELRLEA